MNYLAIEPLPWSPPFQSDQTFRSWTSALASSHHAPSGSEFMEMLGLSKTAACRPSREELIELGRLTKEDPERLCSGVLTHPPRDTGSAARLGNQVVDASINAPYRVCPACIAEDIDPANVANPERTARERRAWIPSTTTHCYQHRIPLIELGSDGRADFAELIRENLSAFQPSCPVQGAAETLGAFISDRLSDGAMSVSGLDGARIRTITQTCRILGTILQFGTADRQDLTAEELYDLANLGFELIRRGDVAVEKSLDQAIATSGKTNLRAVFGKRTIGKLSAMSGSEQFIFLRKHLVAAAHRHRMYGRVTKVLLGIPAPEIRDWTINEAAAELHMAAPRVRDYLVAAGHVMTDEHEAKIRLNGDQIAQLKEFNAALPGERAASFIGVSPTTLRILHKDGLLTPIFVRRSVDGKPLPDFATGDLDHLRQAILANCTGELEPSMVPITVGSGHVARSTAAVLRLLLAGPQAWAFRAPGQTALSRIQVSVDALRKSVKLTDTAPGVREAADQLGIDRQTLSSVIKSGHIAHHCMVNPVNLRRQRSVSPDEIRRFSSVYVGATVLSGGKSPLTKCINNYLSERGVSFIGHPVRVYAWSDLERIIGVRRFEGLIERLRYEAAT